MKFLHCADLHLGCVGGQERMRAFERMLDFCKREGVSVLLIAGDLFEAVRADERTRRRVFDLLAGNPSLCTMIAAGNHDPLCAGGNYDGSLPGNVYVFGHDWSCAEIPAYGVKISFRIFRGLLICGAAAEKKQKILRFIAKVDEI